MLNLCLLARLKEISLLSQNIKHSKLLYNVFLINSILVHIWPHFFPVAICALEF